MRKQIYEIAMRINAHHRKIKLSLANKPCSLFEWRISSHFFNETSSDLNLIKNSCR